MPTQYQKDISFSSNVHYKENTFSLKNLRPSAPNVGDFGPRQADNVGCNIREGKWRAGVEVLVASHKGHDCLLGIEELAAQGRQAATRQIGEG
jgi:hypothetical protein